MNKDIYRTREAIDQSTQNFINEKNMFNGSDIKETNEIIANQVLRVCDVTLRDGQQQRTDEVSISQRVQVFDSIVETGVDRVEIGHLANTIDQQLARKLVGHIANMENIDPRYKSVQLQVLFGSQEDKIIEGSNVLRESFQEHYGPDWLEIMQNKVVVHVYDRIDSELIKASADPYTQEESANRVSSAAMHAIDSGFKNFSISGEAATAVRPEEAIEFYRHVITDLINSGAETVNVNLANTYGFSHNIYWNNATLNHFNRAVKYGFGTRVTTSIHSHNDVNNALDISMSAIVAGFDRVETTHIGMGERSGNVASVDVMSRMIEQARHTEKIAESEDSEISNKLNRFVVSKVVSVDQSIIDNIINWYNSGQEIAQIYGKDAEYRWNRTTLGNPYAHDNGSGPHDANMAAAIIDPEKYPADSNYEWNLIVNNIMGRDTEQLILGDPKFVDGVTVGNHAAGGKTKAIKEGRLVRASDETIERAENNLKNRKATIISLLAKGVIIYS